MRVFFLAVLAGLLAGSAFAERMTQTCTFSSNYDATSVNCDQFIDWKFEAEGPGAIHGLRLGAPDTHCSRVFYYVSDPDTLAFYGETPFMAAGESAVVEIGRDFARGQEVRLRIGVVGEIGGCNAGAIQSWGVDIENVVIPE